MACAWRVHGVCSMACAWHAQHGTCIMACTSWLSTSSTSLRRTGAAGGAGSPRQPARPRCGLRLLVGTRRVRRARARQHGQGALTTPWRLDHPLAGPELPAPAPPQGQPDARLAALARRHQGPRTAASGGRAVGQHAQSARLGSAPAQLLCLLGARLAALGSSALPGRGRPTGCPATASGA
eukprot:scaffold16277_cov57-Phaeocystis_antarctica.AAC.6